MKRTVKQFSFLTLASLAVLSACGNTGQENTENTGEEQQILNLAAESEMDTMDTTISTTNFTPMNNVFEGLITYDLEGNLVPGNAAAMPEVSEDGLTYTFTLREDANWSNGTPVTADDFVFAWKRMVNPENGSGYAYLFSGIINNAEAILNGETPVDELGVEAVDDKTLKVTLEKPVPYFLDVLTIPSYFPQNEAFVMEQGENYGLTAENAIYNGPFTLVNWDAASGDSWKYVKNDDYWDKDTVILDEINTQVVKEVGTGLNLFESGELDSINLSGDFVAQYTENPDFKTNGKAWINYIEVNHAVPELANENIRKALTYAINRQGFTDNVLLDGSQPTFGHVPNGLAKNPETGVDFREDAGDVVEYNVETAQEAWQAGLDELGTESISLELTTSDSEDSKKLAEFLQSELQNNLPGLTIDIRQMPDNSRLDNIKSGNYEIATSYWLADFADPINFVERFDTDINRGNYSFENIDALIDQSNQQYDDALERWNTLIEIEKVALGEHYVHVPVYQTAEAYLEKPYVKDIYRPVFGSRSFKYASIDSTK
ncbi:peptide ABC transporter substrate-binding protein [Carnobacterium viridans]|uniref:Oligopeptide transport system substrate-binding protein n=1 Tax=Carnobacterium viridans TaxID=174587 RepID=A0A1H0ZB33_9LACT|nr:peptide ABC transporter substrate-binding protein [Carnobacterium viridans]UDE94722.1 peptide ABC transporter substrate-binding protein [Carnobacterium viridans]SDQ24589.1 oligopeptide transport system substrate-binding protein [Carnobacterium viridans]